MSAYVGLSLGTDAPILCQAALSQAEDAELTEQITNLVVHEAPDLLNVFGVGPDVAGALLITVGGSPDRMRNEANFAAL